MKDQIPFTKEDVIQAIWNGRHEKLTVETELGVFEFTGSGTVWYSLPMMDRCPTTDERVLLELWKYCKYYGGDYPNAHAKV